MVLLDSTVGMKIATQRFSVSATYIRLLVTLTVIGTIPSALNAQSAVTDDASAPSPAVQAAVKSVTPNNGLQGQTLASVAVVGQSTNFVNGTTVAGFGAGITVNSTTVTDATHATVSITIQASATPGARTVTMTTGTEAATLANAFTVVGRPVVTSVTPNNGLQGQTLASIAVVGQFTHFANGTTVAGFGAGITVNSTTVTDATHATVSITIQASATPGARTVTMTTGTEAATLAGGFTVVGLPIVTSVTPNNEIGRAHV